MKEKNIGAYNWGFVAGKTQTITGKLCFGSLLKYRAAIQLSGLFEKMRRNDKANQYKSIASAIRRLIPRTFADQRGILRASTGLSNQPDVWATAFAVYIDGLGTKTRQKACETLTRAYYDGTLAMEGNIRHILTTDDYNDSTAWQISKAQKNRYQNGAYWGTPVGWVCYAIHQVDPVAAEKLAKEYILQLRKSDFRQGAEYGGPYECIYPPDNYQQNPVYMTSVTCPYAAFKRLPFGN